VLTPMGERTQLDFTEQMLFDLLGVYLR
jgi:hypothetical protein